MNRRNLLKSAALLPIAWPAEVRGEPNRDFQPARAGDASAERTADRQDREACCAHGTEASSGIPLGGLGTGTVELRADGCFHAWQIFNNAPWSGWSSAPPAGPTVAPADAFFAVRVKTSGRNPVVRLLCHDDKRAWAQMYLLPWLHEVQRIKYSGRFPFARLDYEDQALPDISLEAFSPFIPHNAKDSALPLVFFTFTVKNRASSAVELSLLFSLKNLVGYDAPDPGWASRVAQVGGHPCVEMFAEKVAANHPRAGSLAITAVSEAASYYAGIRSRDMPWQPKWGIGWATLFHEFRNNGRLPNRTDNLMADQRAKDNYACALCSSISLAPGEEKRVTFALSWYFPNHFDSRGERLGHMYENWFSSAAAVVEYGVAKATYLRQQSNEFVDLLYDSSLEPWLAASINAPLNTLAANSWWTKDDRFAIWEGTGCCGLNTICTGFYYSHFPVLVLFPELEKKAMEMSREMQREDGWFAHFWPGTFSKSALQYFLADHMPDYSLCVYRDYLWTGDEDFLQRMWPTVKKGLDLMIQADTDADGLPDKFSLDPGSLPERFAKVFDPRKVIQTYDQWYLPATQSYLGTLHIAALKAGAKMAEALGEKELKKRYEETAERATSTFEKLFWNGEYYNLFVDLATGNVDKGCLADQVNGQWYARLLDLGTIHPEDHVRSALGAVYRYNRKPGEGLVNGADPVGRQDWSYLHEGPSGSHFRIMQWTTPWQGTEHAVAATMIQEGLVKEGLQIIRDAYERYARAGMLWNSIECGEHYIRALAIWTALFGLQGLTLDARNGVLSLRQRLPGNISRTLLVTPQAYGRLTQRRTQTGQEAILEIAEGSLSLNTVRLGVPSQVRNQSVKGRMAINKTAVQVSARVQPNWVELHLRETVRPKAGDTLRIQVEWGGSAAL